MKYGIGYMADKGDATAVTSSWKLKYLCATLRRVQACYTIIRLTIAVFGVARV